MERRAIFSIGNAVFAGLAEMSQEEDKWLMRVPVVGEYMRDEAISVRHVRNPPLMNVSFKKHELEANSISESKMLMKFAPNPRREWVGGSDMIRERVIPYYWSLPKPGEVIVFRNTKSHFFTVYQVTGKVGFTSMRRGWTIPVRGPGVDDGTKLKWFPRGLHKSRYNAVLRIPSHLKASILSKTLEEIEGRIEVSEEQRQHADFIRALLFVLKEEG